MTRWQSLPLSRNTAHNCHCFDCLRAGGITLPVLDALGMVRDRRDGRYTATLKETVKNEKGETKTQTIQTRHYVGT